MSLGFSARAALAVLLLTCVGSGYAQTPSFAGKLAFALPKKRGFLITDFQGRALRTIRVPGGRTVIGKPDFNARGSRLWFLTSTRNLARTWLHVVPAAGAGAGRAYPLRSAGSDTSNILVSPREDRLAIGKLPGDTRGCGSAVVVTGSGRRLRDLEATSLVGVDISSWSPIGGRLVYIVNRWAECGKFAPAATLFVTGRGGARPDKRVAAERNGFFSPAAWSPDARRLAFSQCDGPSLRCRLTVLDVTTGRRRNLGGNPYPLDTVWAAKTNEVVTARSEPNGGIWAFAVDSPGVRRIAGEGDIEGASLDGNRVVIYRSESRNRGVLDVESGTFLPFARTVQRRLHPEGGAAAYFVR